MLQGQRWKAQMLLRSKLRTYKLFKTNLSFEKYLESDNSQGRTLMTRLRSGTNDLQIERGRWAKQAVEERLCTQCNLHEVENEHHFLIGCPKYQHLRQE